MDRQDVIDSITKELPDPISQELIDAFWDGVEHYNTTDLVLFLGEDELIRIFPREFLLDMLKMDTDSSLLRRKIAQSAAAASGAILTTAKAAFWFVLEMPDDQMVVTTITTTVMSKGGEA